MKKLLVLLITFAFAFSIAQSEEKILTQRQKAVKFLLKEKLKITPEEAVELRKTGKIQRFVEINARKNKNPQTQATDNILVSGDEVPESEVHAAMNPKDSNNIMISPIRMDTDPQNFQDMLLCPVYYTKDFGKSWNKSTFKNTPAHQTAMPGGGGDPMFIFDKNGVGYLTWIYLLMTFDGSFQLDSMINTMSWAYTIDGGTNWSRAANQYVAYTGVDYGNGESLTDFYDKQWMTADYSNSPYSNNIYLSLTHMAESEGYNIKVFTKENNSNEFNKGVRVNQRDYQLTQFSAIDVDNLGNVHVLFYGTDGQTNTLYHNVSTDGGKTFGQEKKITDFVLDGSNMLPGNSGNSYTGITQDRLYPCPQMAIDKSGTLSDGTIYVSWTANGINENLGNSLDIYFIKSNDGGNTWSTPKVVNDDAKGMRFSNFYSNISVNPNGVVILSWYDRREDQTDRMGHYYMTYSFDQGNSFMENFPVTDVKTDYSTIGELNSDFGVGEYNMLLSTKGYAIPVWSDGRSGDGNMNIYTAFVPITNTTPVAETVTPINGTIILNDPVPNPALNSSSISLNLTKDHNVKLVLVDEGGNVVLEIAKEKMNAGEYSFNIDTKSLSSGNYYIHLVADTEFAVKKIIIIK